MLQSKPGLKGEYGMSKFLTKELIKEITSMNDRDTDNLYFLLKTPNEVLLDWYEKMEEDDHLYAKELLNLFQEALNNKTIEQKIQEMSSFDEANKLLMNFKK